MCVFVLLYAEVMVWGWGVYSVKGGGGGFFGESVCVCGVGCAYGGC